MSTYLQDFYSLLQFNLSNELEDEIKIYNKITNSVLSKPENLHQSLHSIIKLECNEIDIITNVELQKLQSNLQDLKTFLQSVSNIECAKVIIKILAIFYRLKSKLHIILGTLGVDYNLYVDKNTKENWYTFLEDKIIFDDIYKVYLVINNPVHFHYKQFIYQTVQHTNQYYFKSKDEDLFYLYSYILFSLPENNFKEYLTQLKLFGQDHIDDIFKKIDRTELVINKAKDLKNIYDLFLYIVSFDKSIQNFIRTDRDHDIITYKITMQSSAELEQLYQNMMQQDYNKIDIDNNLPNYIDYSKFNTKDVNKQYQVTDIISTSYLAVKLFINYKRYLQMTNSNDKKTFKILMKKYSKFNNILYESLSIFYNQVYYLLFNYNNKEFVLSYYLSNISKYDNYLLEFIIKFIQQTTFELDNTYLPTATLSQVKSIYNSSEENREKLIEFIIKKIFNIDTFNNEYKNYARKTIQSITNNKDDAEIYINLIKSLPIEKIEYEGSRGQARIHQLSSVFTSKYFNSIKSKDIVYLDYGGGDGEITAAIARYIKSEKNNTYLYDVEQWFGNVYDLLYKDNITYGTITQYRLPFENNSVDFITCFQVLHHIDKYELIISELYRILKPGGILILREHDCRNSIDRMIIDVEHSIFETVLKKTDYYNTIKYLSEYEAYYKSKNKWNDIFILNKFKNITANINNKLTEPKSLARYYYDVYTK